MKTQVYAILKSNNSSIKVHQIICTDNISLVEELVCKVECKPNEVVTYIKTSIETLIEA